LASFNKAFESLDHRRVLLSRFENVNELSRQLLLDPTDDISGELQDFHDSKYQVRYKEGDLEISYYSKTYLGPDTDREYFLECQSKKYSWRTCVPRIYRPISPFVINGNILFIIYKEEIPTVYVLDLYTGSIKEQKPISNEYYAITDIPYYMEHYICIPMAKEVKSRKQYHRYVGLLKVRI
jgi:hypothetical protein